MCLVSASAFTSKPVVADVARPKTAIPVASGVKQVAASFVVGAFLAANVFAVEAAFAVSMPGDMDFGASEVIAGRSGGRGGGRAYRAPSRSYSAPRSSSTTRTVQRTTIVQPVYSTPSVIVSPFGYNPMGGFGM